ncbi:hypothetical protein AWZ03_011847 [Drosophila navojoa]|uniref:Uncharacterized protein n=1 Tax=Drosophila navojoa TaxID=7232 RepID=A0A484B1N9_DRONA|nr:hypothetical protein AWZ03_011847 [Drosophila navojoa]
MRQFSSLSGSPSIVFVANLGSKGITVDLDQFDKTLPTHLTLKIRSISSTKAEGSLFETKGLSLAAGEALVMSTD